MVSGYHTATITPLTFAPKNHFRNAQALAYPALDVGSAGKVYALRFVFASEHLYFPAGKRLDRLACYAPFESACFGVSHRITHAGIFFYSYPAHAVNMVSSLNSFKMYRLANDMAQIAPANTPVSILPICAVRVNVA